MSSNYKFSSLLKNLLIISLLLLLTSCIAQYKQPTSGPVATMTLYAHKEVTKYQLYAFEKVQNQQKECYHQREVANVMILGPISPIQFKIPADHKLVARVVTEQMTDKELDRCDMIFSFTPKANTNYEAHLMMDKDNPNCSLLISEQTKDGLQPIELTKEDLNQTWKQRLTGNTFCKKN